MQQKVFSPTVLLVVLVILGIGGFLLYNQSKNLTSSNVGSIKQQTQSNLDQSLEPKVQVQSVIDDTKDWQTYSDENIIFKYPKDWKVQPKQAFDSRQEVVFFKDPNNTALRLSLIGNYWFKTGKPYKTIEDYTKPQISNKEGFRVEDVTFNGNNFKLIFDQGIKGHAVPTQEAAIFSKDESFIVSLLYYPVYSNDVSDKTLENILSTFKFTN